MASNSVTVVLPTYEEFESLPSLVEALLELRQDNLQALQLIIVDDNSNDGTEKLIEDMQFDWIRLIVRRDERGLSSAVIHGLKEATTEVCVVMDADGSHPVSTIPAMVQAVTDGADFAVGSRYVTGGTTEDDWGFLRWLNSKIATIMARPFTKVLDPMSGFLAFRKSTFEKAEELNPVGYKIGLELIVKCRCTNVAEV
ncbi:MAG: glycosyltransferase, partial [Phycisphaerales bacterium]